MLSDLIWTLTLTLSIIFILSDLILSYMISLYNILACLILSYLILADSIIYILSCRLLSYIIVFYLILSLVIFIFLAWGYNQYTPKKYHIWTKIEIKDDKNTDEVMDIADILSFSNNANLENQKEILKSYSLAENTIKK